MRLLFWVGVACRFLHRSGRITIVLSGMLFSAISALVFLSSLSVGINDAMIHNSVYLYSGHITGFDLPASLSPEKLNVSGVQKVLQRVQLPGIATAKDRIEALTLVGIDPKEESVTTAVWKRTVSGHLPEPGEPGLLIGKALAESLRVDVGDMLIFTSRSESVPLSLSVRGIFETGIFRFDKAMAFCPLKALPPSGQRNWEAAVFLDDGIAPADVLSVYRNLFPVSIRFSSWEELMPDLRQLIDLNIISMSLVTVLVFGVVSIGIACGFVIFILKNMREYAIMKAMGTSAGELALLLYAKVLLVTIAGSITGCLVGMAAVWGLRKTGVDLSLFTSYNQYFIVSGVIYPRLTRFSLGAPPATALVFSLVAAAWPAALLIRKKAADILRGF